MDPAESHAKVRTGVVSGDQLSLVTVCRDNRDMQGEVVFNRNDSDTLE
jgi:hypothetical protein